MDDERENGEVGHAAEGSGAGEGAASTRRAGELPTGPSRPLSRPAPAPRRPSSGSKRRAAAVPPYRDPSRSVDSEAQIEQWRARQATRAVRHPEYGQGGGRRPQGGQRPPHRQGQPQQPQQPRQPQQPKQPKQPSRIVRPQPKPPFPDEEQIARLKQGTAKAARGASAAARASAAKVGEAVGRMDPGLRRKAIAIGAAILVYFIVMIHFSLHFYPNSTIGSVDISGMDVSQAASALGDAADDYELQVEGENGVSFTVMSHEAGLTLDSEDLVRQAMDANPGILWPIELLLPHDHSDVIVASADTGGFRDKISDAVNWYNSSAEAPRDATISYDEGDRSFKVVQEERGNMLDEEKIVEHVEQALAVMQPKLVLGDDDYRQPAVYADDERLQEALQQARRVLSTNVTFQAHDSDVATLDGGTAAKWVRTDEDVQVVLDEDQLNVWVQELVDKSSTVGARRTWTREDGVECTVEGGVYGWEADWLAVDEAVHDAVYGGKSENMEVPMSQKAAVYNGEHGRDWKSYIDVDLDAQHAVYYDDDGKVLWEASFVSGTPDGKHDTPQGVYYINNKESPSLLVGEANATGSPEYQTVVQYWIPWRGNDVGFHDADWQDAFGGTRYLDGYGSHGCINLSPEDVAALYRLAPVDTVVVCHGSGTVQAAEAQEDSPSASPAPGAEDREEPSYDAAGDGGYAGQPADDAFDSEDPAYPDEWWE